MTFGLLGSADLTAATDTLICTAVGSHTVNIRVTNRTSDTARIQIAIGTGVSPAAKDYIEFNSPVDPWPPLENTGIAVSDGEKIWVRSDIAGCTARVHGIPIE